jgi:hypothetical protein
MPDKDGNVTLTVMGSFRCPKCDKSLTAAFQKIKGDQFGGGKSKKELLIEVASSQNEPTPLDDLAGQVGLGAQSVEKAITLLIKKGDLKGKIVDGAYVP